MRLHSLAVTAFGPFAGTETVDFDALAADGLFLLHGPTGAGKTTVLDAVAFALFGKLPGARQDADGRRLLSDHAAAGARPRVQLELTVGGRRLRIDRSPEHQRAKKRGAGTTTEQAKASLTWLGVPAAEGVHRVDEVAREVERLLGMSADQFFQVVLLPQGEFARFLRASTDERSTLLEKLFDTARFGGAETWLSEHRRTASRTAEEGRSEVEVLLGRLGTAAGMEQVPAADGPVLDWVEELVRSTELGARLADTELQQAQRAATDGAKALALARTRSQLVARRDEATVLLRSVTSGTAERAEQAATLAANRRAAAVAVAVQDAAELRDAASQAESEVSALAVLLGADPDGAAALELSAGPALQASCTRWRAEVGQLAELVALDTATTAEEVAAQRLFGRANELQQERDALADRRREQPAQRGAVERALVDAQRAADALGALAQVWVRAGITAAAAERVPQLERDLVVAEQESAAAVEAHQGHREHWLDLRERRLLGMAAELAGGLVEGEGCTVCGSITHPLPARPAAEVVRRGDEQRAHEQEQAAAAAIQAAAAGRASAVRALEAARHDAGDLDLAATRIALAAATVAQATAQGLAATLPAERARAQALETALEALTQQELAAGTELATVQAQALALLERAAAARVRLRTACGTDPDVSARLTRMDRLADVGTRLVSARSAAAQRTHSADDRAARARLLAQQEGFAGLPDALAAVLEPARAAALQSALDRARDAEVRVRAVLEEPAVQAVGEVDVALVQDGLARAEAIVAAGETARGQAHGAAATTAARRDQVAELVALLHERLAVLGPVLAEAVRVGALADVVSGRGQNSRKVSLHSYVLAARLEEVAVAASARLQRMSGGRYEFVHSDASGPRGTRGGLGLDVLDDHTGAVRSTKTLSGGESFVASLSLALGLADVVAAEAGGVQLDTLFIDEGFGTLDPATLEEVMVVLDELRAGGRVVGLVSHVDELRQRIPNRLHVRSTRNGSRLVATTGT